MFMVIINDLEKGGAARQVLIEQQEVHVGRRPSNEVMLPRGDVSGCHARIMYRDGRFIVTDLRSKHGTYVTGRKISEAAIVRDGDAIGISAFVLQLCVPS